jgi:hypothetical protein
MNRTRSVKMKPPKVLYWCDWCWHTYGFKIEPIDGMCPACAGRSVILADSVEKRRKK